MEPRPSDAHLDASRLESLLESARILSSSLDLSAQLSHLLRTVMGRLLVRRALVALREDDGFRVAAVRGLPQLQAGSPFDPARAAELGLPYGHLIGEGEEPLGMVAIGAPARGALEQEEVEFLQALLSLAAASIANARAHEDVIRSSRALDQKVLELRSLLDLVRGFTATINPDEVAQLLMLTLSGRWAVRRHALVTWKENQPPIVRLKGMDAAQAPAWRQALGDADAPLEHAGLVLFPIRSGDSTSGVVALGARPGGLGYSGTDLEFGMGLVAQAAVAFDNAWHFRDTLYRQQLEKELSLAASIQHDLFPKSLPELQGATLAARNRQARQVGGDYYDVLPIGEPGPGSPHLLTVADISGKGISASLLMANIQATLRALLSAHISLRELAARTSDLLYASTPSNKYATAVFVRFDPLSGACEYVNGGHCDGILLRADGHVEMLSTTGLPVGLFPRREFESGTLEIRPGDTLMLYSDGVTDACTAEECEFGVERAVDVLKGAAALPPEQILDCVFSAIDEFAAGAPQFDDITVMVLKRTGGGA